MAMRRNRKREFEGRSPRRSRSSAERANVEKAFPAIAKWVGDFGHIEIGDQEGFGFIVRALDPGGLVFEDDKPNTLTEAMTALEAGLARRFQEHA